MDMQDFCSWVKGCFDLGGSFSAGADYKSKLFEEQLELAFKTSAQTTMTARQFCHWLEGYFALGGCIKSLSAAQSRLIRDNLDLAMASRAQGSPESNMGLAFCHYLEAVFEHVDTSGGMMDLNVARVRRRLSEEFENVFSRAG
jgi:hypothetical protein